MGISQSLYTGVTGLSTNSDGMSVIANNIANANAKGFKRDRAEFEDLLSSDLMSGAGPTQVGRGARLRDVKTIHTQGGLKVTDNLTDVAIQGGGFFVAKPVGADGKVGAGNMYTRAGSFKFDKDGYLADSSGARIQGYMSDKDGVLSSRLSDVRIETNNIPPRATKTIDLKVQLDSRVEIMEADWNPQKPELTSHFNSTFSVYDSQGAAHPATAYFRKVGNSEDGTEWDWHVLVDGKEVTDADGEQWKDIANGRVSFDKFGILKAEETFEAEANFANGAFQGQKINLDFGKNIGEEEGTGDQGSTAIAADSITVFHAQDGFEAGNLKSLKIGLDGNITGIFTNGVTRILSSIALATFQNIDGLEKAGKNNFYESVDSGPASIGLAQTGNRGSLFASSLEESNVDLANEFVNMIMTQRLFQANSRSITTTDSMIEEVINLKR